MRIAIATCRPLPEPDVDEPLLLEALANAGIEAEMTAWDNAKTMWGSYDACVVRSTWNYPEQPVAFRNWVTSTGQAVRLFNPPLAMAGNINKRYLQDFASGGVATVPTMFIGPRTEEFSTSHFKDKNFVVKPAISAGSWMARKFGPIEYHKGIEYLSTHAQRQDMMIQPYLPSVESGGEVAWVWIDGQVTHGVRKMPRFDGDAEAVTEAVEPTDEARQIVSQVMAHTWSDLLYARIDLIEHEGKWLLSELELIEPSLFFKQNPAALDVFIPALQRRVLAGK